MRVWLTGLILMLLMLPCAVLAQAPTEDEIAEAHRACRAWNGTATGPAITPGWEHCPKIEEAWAKSQEGAAEKARAAAAARQQAKSKEIFNRLK